MNAQAPPLCNPPQALTNGDFEDTGTCNTGVACNLKAFNSSGCGVPGWIEGYGTPDLCQESGNWYAKMETEGLVGGSCGTEGIVQTLNLLPGCGYELSFRHRTLVLGGTGVDINIYLVSGFTHISPVPGGLSPCPTPDPNWTLVGTLSNFSSSSWVTLSQPFSFVAGSDNPQLLFYPLPVGGSGASIEWNIDDIQLSPCTSPLSPQFNAELASGTTFQFYDQTAGNVTAWCWDFGDGTWSEVQNPQHTFAGTGPYTVCLTILDGNGCKDQICQTIGSPCQCGTANLTLSQNTTWTNQFVNLGNTLIVPPGRTLTVDASTVKVATGCGIIVKQGARLNVLEGSTLRGWCDGGLWNGVRVEGAGGSVSHPGISAIGSGGVPGSYPTSVNQHGVVYAYGSAQNATTIRDAEIALGNQAGFSFGNGGILYADGVTFTENRLSGDILPYPALASPNGPPAAPNISRFTNCSFDLNLSAPPNVPTAQGIRIKGSESILIQNCTFDGLFNDAITGTDYTATIKGCTFQGKIPVAIRVQHTPYFPQAFQFIVGGRWRRQQLPQHQQRRLPVFFHRHVRHGGVQNPHLPQQLRKHPRHQPHGRWLRLRHQRQHLQQPDRRLVRHHPQPDRYQSVEQKPVQRLRQPQLQRRGSLGQQRGLRVHPGDLLHRHQFRCLSDAFLYHTGQHLHRPGRRRRGRLQPL